MFVIKSQSVTAAWRRVASASERAQHQDFILFYTIAQHNARRNSSLFNNLPSECAREGTRMKSCEEASHFSHHLHWRAPRNAREINAKTLSASMKADKTDYQMLSVDKCFTAAQKLEGVKMLCYFLKWHDCWFDDNRKLMVFLDRWAILYFYLFICLTKI